MENQFGNVPHRWQLKPQGQMRSLIECWGKKRLMREPWKAHIWSTRGKRTTKREGQKQEQQYSPKYVLPKTRSVGWVTGNNGKEKLVLWLNTATVLKLDEFVH